MAKRTHGESVAIDGAPVDVNDVPARKKSRKEKKSKRDGVSAGATEAVVNGHEAPVALVQNGEEMEDGTPAVEKPASATDGASDDAAKAAKAERKALKRAKRAAKEAAGSAEVEPPEANGEAGSSSDADAKAAAKAARKAEKAHFKAAKKEEKKRRAKLSASASDTATPDGLTSTSSSAAPSKVQSSATSLEPTPAPESTPSATGYIQDPALTALPQSDIDAYLTSNHISISDPLHPTPLHRPITSFAYLPITDPAQRAPFATFTSPTPIQAAAWPALLAGRDVIGVAETGSGKTLAFGVPCIRHIQSLPASQRRGVKAAIVSPTRELACQIHEQLAKLCGPAGLEAVVVYGGVAKEGQRAALRSASVVVATPGRLNDLISEGAADLSGVSYLVLDEADRMLDTGFEQDMRKIVGACLPGAQRQTLMFTATWPPSVRELAASFLRSPVRVSIGDNPTGELRANVRIAQSVEVVDPHGKEQRLLQILREHTAGPKKDERILIFCLYKKEATRVENFIRAKGFRVAGIHGDLSQVQRSASLEAFKSGKVPLLVATDVAARGLDIPAVKLVVNVTFPLTVEDYVHRIGRTGRAGKEGKAITLFTEHDKGLSGSLINVLKAANQPVPDELLKFGTTVKKKTHDAYGAFVKDIDPTKKATKITFD